MYRQSHLSEAQKETLKEIRDADYKTLSGADKNGIPFLKHVFELHFKIFGETCSNCPSKIGGYIFKLKNFNPDKMELEKEKSQFELNDGVIIPIPGTSDVYSKHNLTDKAALKILAANPNRRALFRVLPEDLDQLLEEYVETDETDDSKDLKGKTGQEQEFVVVGEHKITVERALYLFEQLNIQSKASTATGVAKNIKKLTPEQLNDLVNLASQQETPSVKVKSLDELKADYEEALSKFQELEASGTDEEKEAAFQILEAAQTALEESENID